VRWVVPQPAARATPASERMNFALLLRDPELARLNYGIFVLHAVLMALWVVVPFSLRESGLAVGDHWRVYLPVMLGSIVLMLPPMIASERHNRQKAAFVGSVAVLLAAQGLLALSAGSVWATGFALTVFFAGFNLLEASLPSLVSKGAPSAAKGAAIGVYSSVQFVGTFVGAAAGGYCSQHFGPASVYLLCGALSLSWLFVAAKMRLPARVRIYPVPRLDESSAQGLSRRLAGLPGVREATVPAGAGVARLTVDSARFDEQHVLRLLSGEAR
jgi:predicted MFS family arabinose efflux permease